MAFGKIYETTYWGFVSSTWGSIYQSIAETFNRVTAENGDFLIAENGDNIIIEE
jgi:hypothetical protein